MIFSNLTNNELKLKNNYCKMVSVNGKTKLLINAILNLNFFDENINVYHFL